MNTNTLAKFIITWTLLFPLVAHADRIAGKVEAEEHGVLILKGSSDRPYFALTNYPGDDATYSRMVFTFGKKIGRYTWGTIPVELWQYSPKEAAEYAARQSETSKITNSINPTGPTNRIISTNRPVAQTAGALPADVAEADAKVISIKARISGYVNQSAALQQKQQQRAVAHLAPDMTATMQFNQAQQQIRLLKDQLVQAQRSDYLLRDYHHLPPMR